MQEGKVVLQIKEGEEEIVRKERRLFGPARPDRKEGGRGYEGHGREELPC